MRGPTVLPSGPPAPSSGPGPALPPSSASTGYPTFPAKNQFHDNKIENNNPSPPPHNPSHRVQSQSPLKHQANGTHAADPNPRGNQHLPHVAPQVPRVDPQESRVDPAPYQQPATVSLGLCKSCRQIYRPERRVEVGRVD